MLKDEYTKVATTMAHGVMVITTIIMVTSKITVFLVTTLMSSGSLVGILKK
jgi:hypothetical protein